LVETLARRRERIIIPAPVLTEILCRADSRFSEILGILTTSTHFEIAAFDSVAAVETALSLAKTLKSGSKKQGAYKSWPEIKFDRQIVAIAKTRQATAIYSNDAHVRKLAKESGIPAVAVWELPEPPAIQTEFPLES
jgi:predicted nucleic acid-binding protein